MKITAPRESVWKLHTDVDAWPSWQPDIRSAKLNGAFDVGESFVWQAEGIDEAIISNIYAVSPRTRTFWGGRSSGILGLHEWRFQDNERGTLVLTEESWSGGPTLKNTADLQAALDRSLDRWLDALKKAAEA